MVKRRASSARLSKLIEMQGMAYCIKDAASNLQASITDIYVKNRLHVALVDVASIQHHLGCRIAVFSGEPIPISSPTLSPLKKLASIINVVTRGGDSRGIRDFVSDLQGIEEATLSKIYHILWLIKGCPKSGSEMASEESEVGNTIDRLCFSRQELMLAVELCISPSVIADECIRLAQSNKLDQGLVLFKLLPRKIQESVSIKLSWLISISSLTHPMRVVGRESLFGIIEKNEISIPEKINAVRNTQGYIEELESEVNELIQRYKNEFRSIDSLELDIDESSSISQNQMIKNTRVHEIARELLAILDPEIESKDFAESSMEEIQEIIKDYHARYPSLLHSRVLFLFYPNTFTPDIAPLVSNTVFIDPASILTPETVQSAVRAAARFLGSNQGEDGVFIQMGPPTSGGTGDCPDTALQPRPTLKQRVSTPSDNIQSSIALIESGKLADAIDKLNLLPAKIQESIVKKYRESTFSQATDAAVEVTLSEIIQSQTISQSVKIGFLQDAIKVAEAFELSFRELINRYHEQFISLDQALDISPTDNETIKNLSIHEIAKEFLKILDSKPFVESTMVDIQEIIKDYNDRYPSLLHFKVFSLFYSWALDDDRLFAGEDGILDSSWIVVDEFEDPVAGSSTTRPVLDGSELGVVLSQQEREALSKVVQHMQGVSSFSARPVAESTEESLAIDNQLGALRIAPEEPMIALSLPILKRCPDELRSIVADAILKDYYATAVIRNQTLLDPDIPIEELDRLVWGLVPQINDLQKVIDNLERNPKVRALADVIEILKVKKKCLSDIYLNQLNLTLVLTLKNDTKVFSRIPHPKLRRGVISARCRLHQENLQFLKEKDPKSPLIQRFIEKIEELKKWIEEFPPYSSQQEMLLEVSIGDVYACNLLLADLWLNPLSMKMLQSDERLVVLEYLPKDLSKIDTVIKKAQSLLHLELHDVERKEAFQRDLESLINQRDVVKGMYDLIMRNYILELKAQNINLFAMIFSSSISIHSGILREITSISVNLAEEVLKYFAKTERDNPICCEAAHEFLSHALHIAKYGP